MKYLVRARKILSSQKGVGLAEVIVASGLLLVVSLGVASYLNSAKQLNMKLEGSAECRAIAAQVLNKFKNSDNRIKTSNWHAKNAELKPPFERFANFNIVDNPNIVTASATNAWLLPDTASNSALALYNNAGFIAMCTTAPGGWGGGHHYKFSCLNKSIFTYSWATFKKSRSLFKYPTLS
ncbi:MAG: hypothetical protein SGI74_14335 [Oligoflexia bacterium]|nr:hypothetical protein [Oligoflexia bacterium]